MPPPPRASQPATYCRSHAMAFKGGSSNVYFPNSSLDRCSHTIEEEKLCRSTSQVKMRQRGVAHLAASGVRGGSSVPMDRPDWPNKQGRPMMIMKDMWLWMMHLPIKTCLCRLIYSPITCRVNNASCLRRPTRPGPRAVPSPPLQRRAATAGSGLTRMLPACPCLPVPASLPAG